MKNGRDVVPWDFDVPKSPKDQSQMKQSQLKQSQMNSADEDVPKYATSVMRFEDLTQHGHIRLPALPHTVDVAWHRLLREQPAVPMSRKVGIRAILSRLILVSRPRPIALRERLNSRGTYQLAKVVDGASGETERLILNLWVKVTGTSGRMYGQPPPDAGAQTEVGAVFAEHVFSRPFAPREDRRVVEFGGGLVPEDVAIWQPAAAVAVVPAGVELLGPMRDDPVRQPLSLDHTDNNQHINSLVYLQLFQQAALRRFDELGLPTAAVSAQFVELGFRKPCFAGQQLIFSIQPFRQRDGIGAVGRFRTPTSDPARPNGYVRMLFRT